MAGGSRTPIGDGTRWRSWGVELAVLAWYLALTTVYLWPLLTGLAQVAVHSIRDPGLQATVVNNVTEHLLAGDLGHLFDGSFFYPAHLTLALSDIQLGVQPVALPLRLVVDDALFIHNVVAVATFPLAALTADRLARRLTGGSRLAGWATGTVYAFAAYRFTHLIHLAMLATWVVPLAFLGLEMTLRGRGWRAPILWAVAMVLAASLALHYLLILALIQPIYLVVRFLLAPDRWGFVRRVAALVAPAIGAAAVIGLLLLPYASLAGEGFVRAIGGTYEFSARPSDYVIPAADSAVAHPLYAALKPKTGEDEREISPGLVALGIAAGGLASAAALRRRRWLVAAAPWVVAALASFVLSLGPRLLPDAVVPANATGYLPLPYLALARVLPLLESLRAPARFSVVVLLAVAILAGMTLAAVSQRLGDRPIVQGILVAVVGTLFAIEYSVAPVVAHVAWGPTLPASVRWLAAAPAGPVVEYPLGPVAASTYALHSTVDGHPRLNGWSGFTPKVSAKINVVTVPPSGFPAWLDEAARLGATYFVDHEATLDDTTRSAIRSAADARGMRLAASFETDRIYVFGP